MTKFIPRESYPETWDVAGFSDELRNSLAIEAPIAEWAKEEGIDEEEVAERLRKLADEAYAKRVEANTPDVMRYIEKQIVLQVLDHYWREHLVMLDHLRQVIGYRGYAQRDPLNEYKHEAFELFNTLIARWHETATQQLMRVEVSFDENPQVDSFAPNDPSLELPLDEINARIAAGEFSPAALAPPSLIGTGQAAAPQERDPHDPLSWGKVGRNEPCPCGSGRKYKHCHGVNG